MFETLDHPLGLPGPAKLTRSGARGRRRRLPREHDRAALKVTRLPFETPAETDELFESNARRKAEARLGHLIDLRGIGLLTGEVGSGKTTVGRHLAAGLHLGLYRVHYVSLTMGNVLDMYNINPSRGSSACPSSAPAPRPIRQEYTSWMCLHFRRSIRIWRGCAQTVRSRSTTLSST